MPIDNKDKLPRPEREVHNAVPAMQKKRVSDHLDKLPAKYVLAQQNNTNISACCRDVNNLHYQSFKTNPSFNEANMAVIECEVCGSKHYRVASQQGRP